MRPDQLQDRHQPSEAVTSGDAKRRESIPKTSKRRYWHHRRRETVWYPLVPFGDVPAAARVFLSEMPTSARLDAWCGGAETEVYRDGHYPIVRDAGGPDGGRRTIMSAAQWHGGDRIDAALAGRAWVWTEAAVRRAWKDPELCLLSTPGTTGRDLWLRTPAAEGCPLIGPATAELIRSTASQGRIETMPARAELLPALYEYDMRLAYAALLRGMPIGEPHQLERATVAEVCANRSRALIRFRVPDGWRHVGMFAVREAGADTYTYPGAGAGGRWHGPTWADGCEIELAVRHGWQVEVITALVWSSTGEPLRTWAERLTGILARAEQELSVEGARAVRQLVRSIILHTVGAFHGGAHRVTCRATDLADAPIGATMLRVHDDGSVTWQEQRPARWPEAVHPEWSAHIWARCRRRLLETPGGGGALSIDPAHIVAIRTDAIYTTRATGWDSGDDGKPGRWTLKRVADGPMPWPRTGTDVLSAREGGR